MSIDSSSNALIKIEDLKKEELDPDQNVDVFAADSTPNLQLHCNQTCSKPKQELILMYFPRKFFISNLFFQSMLYSFSFAVSRTRKHYELGLALFFCKLSKLLN